MYISWHFREFDMDSRKYRSATHHQNCLASYKTSVFVRFGLLYQQSVYTNFLTNTFNRIVLYIATPLSAKIASSVQHRIALYA